MAYEPEHLDRWIRPDHYAGAEWLDYYGAGTGQHRDSDALTRSNFRCMLAALGGESETVIVVRERHWAVGWVEWIAIHKTDDKALQTADEIQAHLEDYPVLDDDDFSDLETEEAAEVWADCYSVAARLDYIRRNRDQFEFRDYADMIGCVRGKYFAGHASELLL